MPEPPIDADHPESHSPFDFDAPVENPPVENSPVENGAPHPVEVESGDPASGDPASGDPASGDETYLADAAEVPVSGRAVARLQRRRRHRRRRRRIVGSVALLVVMIVVSVGAWFVYELGSHGNQHTAVAFDVHNGWSKRQIGDALQDHGVIGSSLAFQLYAYATGAGPFEAGRYSLHRNLGIRATVKQLEKHPTIKYSILRLPPGFTLDMIAARVGQLPGRSAEKFLGLAQGGLVRSKFEPPDVHNLEGLTWPDTYYVGEKQDEAAILQMIVARFDDQMDKNGLSTLSAPNGVTQYQALVIASLIQTEAKLDEDRPLISAVISNRLKNNMPLQIDATLLYARRPRSGSITPPDKASDSPYNTYKVTGLPPTPISTLSVPSIKAAFSPADVPYLYYVVADANGKHAFAVTYQDHLKNVAAAKRKGLDG